MMKRNKAVLISSVAVVAGLLGAITICGCGGGGNGGSTSGSTTRLAPETLYGNWRLSTVSGGITGSGYPVEKVTTVTFNSNGTAVQREDGQVTFDGKYRVERTSPQFEGNPPVLEYVPQNAVSPYAITRLDSTHLTLSQEAADGYQFDYERVR